MHIKTPCFLLIVIAISGFLGGSPSVMAGPGDAPHKTHLEDIKGPEIDCSDCHFGNPGDRIFLPDKEPLESTTACDACHSPEGAYNGVNHEKVGAKNNWSRGRVSEIYNENNTLRIGKEKWCATCHDDVPALSKQQLIDPVVVDNTTDPGASFEGSWGTSSWCSERVGNNYHYHLAASGSDKFIWTPTITTAGTYEVFAYVGCEDPVRAPDATYTVYHDDGSTVVTRDLRSGGPWISLGSFSFDGVDVEKVELVQSANGVVIADAISWGGGGVYAPNIVGDPDDPDNPYGFYVTGHKINCLSCHDVSKKHVDHNPRTYDVNESTGDAFPTYCDSYRLKYIDGQPSMNMPRLAGGNPIVTWQDFALCFDCHNRNELLDPIPGDLTLPHTNFWDKNATIGNAHKYHLNFKSIHVDSDWDGVKDSAESCITCHNVHGPPNKAMIRHGELISTPDTTDKVPALDFTYLTGGIYEATATWSAPVEVMDEEETYNVYARWTSADPGRASNAKYIINYNGGKDQAVFDKDQRTGGGQWNQLGTDAYAFDSGDSVVLSIEGADDIVCADAIGWDSDGIFDPDPEHVVDDEDADYTSAYWGLSSWAPGYYGTGYHYHYEPGETPIPDPDATLKDSLGGQMRHRGLTVATTFVCNTCHWPGKAAYIRDPYLGPMVLSPKADPGNIAVQEATLVTFRATVRDPDNNVDTVTIDMSAIGGVEEDMSPINTVPYGNGTYEYQTTVPASDTGYLSFLVKATDNTVPVGLIGEGTITLKVGTFVIVDNSDGSFEGTWGTSSWCSERVGIDYHYHLGVSGSDDTFIWTPTITTAGTYKVCVYVGCEDPVRAPDATYTVYHDGDSSPTVVTKDQTAGLDWVSLGSFSFDGAGVEKVELIQSANGVVIADAIKWELQH